jgi:carboxynorspermidine decarboxylase
LGVPPEELRDGLPAGIEGLHVHALCENEARSTLRLIEAVEVGCGHLLPSIRWLNLGGGHLMTRRGYDLDLLVRALRGFRRRWPWIELVLEPGSAVAWDAGPLISRVLDVVERGGIAIALLDTSATAHMPDVLEMPYRPDVRHGGRPGEKRFTYRLAGATCLAGDIIGDYSFDRPLVIGDRVIFEDMMHYTMVKTSQFNGVRHPAVAVRREDGTIEVLRRFGYEDYERGLS